MPGPVQFCSAPDGTTLAWAAAGSGPPVVKVSGWLSDVGLDPASSVWGHWYRRLARGRRLVAYDPRGSGWSSRSPAVIDFESLVGDLDAVVAAAALDRFALFSSYLGAPVAITYAARHRERVSHLVLHGAAAVGALSAAATPAARAEAEATASLIESSWGRDPMVIDQVFTVQLLPDAGGDVWRALRTHQQRAAAGDMAARLFRAYESADVTALCAKVKCPVLVTHSAGDARVTSEEGRELARGLRGEFVELDSRNHLLLEDEPAWDAWCRRLEDFLPSQARASPQGAGALDALSAREKQVLELMARGLDNPSIARRLVISEKTVRNYVSTLFDKLGVTTRAEAIVIARGAGWGASRRPRVPES